MGGIWGIVSIPVPDKVKEERGVIFRRRVLSWMSGTGGMDYASWMFK